MLPGVAKSYLFLNCEALAFHHQPLELVISFFIHCNIFDSNCLLLIIKFVHCLLKNTMQISKVSDLFIIVINEANFNFFEAQKII